MVNAHSNDPPPPAARRARHIRRRFVQTLIDIAFIQHARNPGRLLRPIARGLLARADELASRPRPSQPRTGRSGGLPPRRSLQSPEQTATNDVRLAVPAIDPRVHNPIGWRRVVEDHRFAALGPLPKLPHDVSVPYAVKNTDLHLIRHCHHLVDVGDFHANARERAGTLLGLAATGALIHVADDDSELRGLVGNEFYSLLKTDIQCADANTRELQSIRMRRIALRDHFFGERTADTCDLFNEPPSAPSVSILLATNRPNHLEQALAQVRKQNYPELELVLALHGDGFGELAVKNLVSRMPCALEIVRVGAEQPFPVVLNAATAAANGQLTTKMDDDDIYGEDHVWDLVLAHQYSGAHLVGKAAEVVYLQRRDQTVERNRNGGERYSRSIAGGTLFVARDDLKAIGGWRGVRPYVDRTLIDNVLDAGGLVYRTHGHGYVLIRHGERHSWDAGDDYFIDGATTIHDRWCGYLAGVGKTVY